VSPTQLRSWANSEKTFTGERWTYVDEGEVLRLPARLTRPDKIMKEATVTRLAFVCITQLQRSFSADSYVRNTEVFIPAASKADSNPCVRATLWEKVWKVKGVVYHSFFVKEKESRSQMASA
jgi:hypothetical protein